MHMIKYIIINIAINNIDEILKTIIRWLQSQKFRNQTLLASTHSVVVHRFPTLVDNRAKNIQSEVSRCMLFTDYIVLVGESHEKVNSRLEKRKKTLEEKESLAQLEGRGPWALQALVQHRYPLLLKAKNNMKK